MIETKLKYICSSFSSNLSLDRLKEIEKGYPVYGASGYLFNIKDFVINRKYLGIVKDGAGVGRINVYPEKSSLLGTMAYILPNKNIELKWLKYCIESLNLGQSLDLTTIPHIYFSQYGNNKVLLPPIEEQKKIAEFLDDKCEKIDSLMQDINAEIDTLELYKRSLITETVTKGLNPDAKMKDSGIEWIGTIPDEWTIRKGKYMFAQRSFRGNSVELQLLSPTQKFGVIPQALYEELSGMTAVKLNEKADLNTLKTIHKGDFCISLRSFQGGFEYCEYEGVVSPAYQVFYPTVEIADGYYKYLFKETGFIEKMNSYTMTLRDGKNIAFADFGNTYIPYPPVQEQREIAEFLDKKCAEIDKVISDKKEQLSVIDNYKKSLIYEYVTGKKEVTV